MSIRVAIAGVGNCASSLVQGVEYYKDTKDEDKIPGLMHNNFGGYRVRDIEFVTAFDVDADKVGKDLSEAIGASQNNTIKFADVPNLGVEVLRGPTHDGLGEYYREMITESDEEPVDVAQVLRDKKYDYIVSSLAGTTLEEQASSLGSEVADFKDVNYASFYIDGAGFEPRLVGGPEGSLDGPRQGYVGRLCLRGG